MKFARPMAMTRRVVLARKIAHAMMWEHEDDDEDGDGG